MHGSFNSSKILTCPIEYGIMRNEENNSADFECLPRILFPPKQSSLVHKIGVDLSSIILVLIPILCLFLWGKPYHRGFNCDDDSIRYPYLDNTISSVALYFYSTLIPFFTICLNEFLLIRFKFSSSQTRSSVSTKHFWKCYLWQIYLHIIPLAFAAASSQLMTDIAKYSIGRLRPHFIDRCRPRLPTGEVIDRLSNCDHPYTYVIDYTCTNLISDKSLRDSRLSFMSGHSSFSAVCLIYLVIYLQARVRWHSIGLIKSLVQCLLVSLVLYTGLSRISDYKHHWSDVLTGLIQGTLVAILVALFVSDLFKSRSYFGISRPNSFIGTNQVDPESGV